MSQECIRVLKYMMFVFNLIFWVAGCSIIAMGIYYLVNDIYGTLVPETSSLTVGNILIVTGCIIMVFGFIGCMGAIKENKCLLLTMLLDCLLWLLQYIRKIGESRKSDFLYGCRSQPSTSSGSRAIELWTEVFEIDIKLGVSHSGLIRTVEDFKLALDFCSNSSGVWSLRGSFRESWQYRPGNSPFVNTGRVTNLSTEAEEEE
ncbi:leukocyte surface antigen CD53 [Pelobates cultripes]|nr:leukocyte surface antigen CD53 [Pelobates cultripes]